MISSIFVGMKSISITIVSFLILSCLGIQAQQVQALFSHAGFLMGGRNPYLETYLMVNGESVRFVKTAEGKFRGEVEVILTASQDENIVFADKYLLLSPESADSVHVGFNFIDQQRIPLPAGDYKLGIEVKDANSNAEAVKASLSVSLKALSDSMIYSGIQLVESYKKTEKPGPLSKGGYDLVPHISEFYGKHENHLIFYTECYGSFQHLGEGQKFLQKFYIEDQISGKVLPQFSGFERSTAAAVNVLMKELNIEELPNGNYRLVIEARDRENNLLARNTQDFVRSNPGMIANLDNLDLLVTEGTFTQGYTNPDSLAEHIRSLSPLSSSMERTFAENVVKEKNFNLMKQFFLSFWLNRSPSAPREAWERYRAEVIKVQKEFASSIRRGYSTDRGRVYLQYGPPDNRTVSTYEPAAYPYEIWHYYKLGNQSNRRFVFYNPDLVSNDYTLIHSDALGEIMNDQWQFLIMKRDTQTNDIDLERTDPHFGSQLQQNFQTPR
jgi:GWxTD domain-containing protein